MLAHVGNIRGHLLLIHGLLDENVHFRHTARLVKALLEHEKAHELVMLPQSRHSVRLTAERMQVEKKIIEFFDHTLCDTNDANDTLSTIMRSPL